MKSRIHATLPIVLLAGLCLPLHVRAQGCPSSIIGLGLLTPDGNPTSLNIGGDQTSSFLGDLSAGRSYSLDIVADGPISQVPASNGAAATLPVVARQPGAGDCSFPLTERTLTDPKIVVGAVMGQAMAGRRFTFLAPTSGQYGFFVTNKDFFNLAHDFTVRLVETTLFNPAWSTFGTFETFYSCINTTDSGLNATLKLFTIAGTQVGSLDLNSVAGGTGVSTNTGVLAVGNNQNGYAVLTHNGPPGAFKCEAAIADFATAPRVIQPVRFEPAREMR